MTNHPRRRNNARKEAARAHQAKYGGEYRDAARAVTQTPRVPSFAEALGITTRGFDPASVWRTHEHDSELQIPVGHDEDGAVVTVGVPGLIFGLVAAGSGGLGKSTLLAAAAAALCLQYSPKRVNLLLADLDALGQGTFADLPTGLPHVLQHWMRTPSADDPFEAGVSQIVDELGEVLRFEYQRRQDILAAYRVDSIGAYRQADLPPDAPVLPDLVAIIDAPVGRGVGSSMFPPERIGSAEARANLGIHVLSWLNPGDSGRCEENMRQLIGNVGYRVGLGRAAGSHHVLVMRPASAVLDVPDDGRWLAPPTVFNFARENAVIVKALRTIPTG